MIQFHSILKV